MTAWPGTLPPTLIVNGLNHSKRSRIVAQQPDTGPRMYRTRFSAVFEMYTGNMVMTAAQWATALTFFDTTLAGGSLPFDFKHPITGATVNAQFLADDAQALCITSTDGAKLIVGLKLELGPL